MPERFEYEHLRVLLVDDDRFMLTLVKIILQSLGFKQIMDSTNAADAFKMLKESPADLIITDWEMEPLDGLDFIRMVRQAEDSPNQLVPIILLSAHTDARRVVEARDAGVNEVVAKPVSANALDKRINAIFTRPRAFIRTERYSGPDRRRRNDGPPPGIKGRRADDPDLAPAKGSSDELAEIQALLGRK